MRAVSNASRITMQLSESWLSKALASRGAVLPDGALATQERLESFMQTCSKRYGIARLDPAGRSNVSIQLAYKEVNEEVGGPLQLERGIVGRSMRPVVLPAARLVHRIDGNVSSVDACLDSKRLKSKVRSMIHHMPGLLKAIGWRKDRDRTVLDCTGGLGHDAVAMASFGGTRVVTVERHPAVAAILDIGLQRMEHDKDFVDIFDDGRLQMLHDDARQVLRRMLRRELSGKATQAARPDIVYMDPMFSHDSINGKAGRAAPKSGSQILGAIVRSDEQLPGSGSGSGGASGARPRAVVFQEEAEQLELLRLALLVAKERVVVKTHKSLQAISGKLEPIDSSRSQGDGNMIGSTVGSNIISHGEVSDLTNPQQLVARADALHQLQSKAPVPRPMFSVPGKSVRFDVFRTHSESKREELLHIAKDTGMLSPAWAAWPENAGGAQLDEGEGHVAPGEEDSMDFGR